MKKKVLSCLATSILLSLVACGGGTEDSSQESHVSSVDSQESINSEVSSNEEVSSNVEESSEQGLSAVEVGTKLAATPYACEELMGVSDFGLTDASNVGVVVNDLSIAEEHVYGDNCVIEFDSITLSDVQEYYPEVNAMDDYHAAKTCFEKAKELSDGNKYIAVKFPNKILNIDCSYVEGSRAFEFSGLKKVDILGMDTTFNLQYNNLQWKGYMSFNSCEEVFVKGFNFQAEVPSTLTGQISTMDVENKTSTIKVDPEFNPLVEHLLNKKIELCEYLEYDVNTKVPLMGGNFFDRGVFEGYDISGDATNGYTITVKFTNAITRSRNNSYVVLAFSEYDVSGFDVGSCSNMKFENVNIYHAPGMAFVSSNTNGLLLNYVNIQLKPGSNSLMTATADGFHFNSVHGDVQITNSIIENSHDDALNIKHGYWYKVTNADNTSKVMSLAKMTGAIETPQVGDRIAVYNEDTFVNHNPKAGYYTVKEVTTNPSGFDVVVNERMSGTNEWGNCRATILRDVPNFVFKNNIVRNKRNRGILVQVPNALVENNTFMNVGHGSIQAASAMDQFNECTIPQAITVKNNKFIGNIYLQPEPLYGDVSVFAISKNASVAPKGTINNCEISNNFFTANGNAGVCFRGVGDSTIANNFFYECCKHQVSGEQTNCLINAYNTETVAVNGNYSYYTLDKGMSGIYLQGLSTESDFTLTNNTGIDFYRSSEVGPDEDIAKATGAITFDGDLSEWSSIGATDIKIIAASQATGDEIALKDVEDHFKINKALITHTDDGICMAFDVFDNERDVKPSAAFWTGDCIEILASTLLDMPSADTQVYKDNGGVLQIAFAPTWSATNYCSITSVRSNSNYVFQEKSVIVGMSSSDNGYTCEFCLPYSVFPEFKDSVDAGNRIAMAIVVADSERADLGVKRVQAGNVPHFVENYKTKTEMMPRYKFN